jgi:hypothetical protein
VLLCVAIILPVACTGGSDQSPGPGASPPTATIALVEPEIESRTIVAPSIEGNLLGDPAEVQVSIRVPAEYANSDHRYPVVYFLQGYGESASVGPINAALDGLVADGEARELIVVSISGRNAFGGSFYVDSPVARAMGRNADTRFSAAYGMAFAPDPDGGPPFLDYPYAEPGGPVDTSVWDRWEAGYGGIADEASRFADGLRTLRGIVVDYGTRDEYEWIPPGCEYFAEQLRLNDVPVRVERFDGGHGPASLRAAEIMWPFFDETLAAG